MRVPRMAAAIALRVGPMILPITACWSQSRKRRPNRDSYSKTNRM